MLIVHEELNKFIFENYGGYNLSKMNIRDLIGLTTKYNRNIPQGFIEKEYTDAYKRGGDKEVVNTFKAFNRMDLNIARPGIYSLQPYTSQSGYNQPEYGKSNLDNYDPSYEEGYLEENN